MSGEKKQKAKRAKAATKTKGTFDSDKPVTQFVDHNTDFISVKDENGKPVKLSVS